MDYVLTNTIAFALLVSLATYFVLQSAEAASPPEGTRRSRDLFAAIFTAFIAIMLVALAGYLLDPAMLGVPKPPPWIRQEWFAF